jgi:hypothetical protein
MVKTPAKPKAPPPPRTKDLIAQLSGMIIGNSDHIARIQELLLTLIARAGRGLELDGTLKVLSDAERASLEALRAFCEERFGSLVEFRKEIDATSARHLEWKSQRIMAR